MKPTQTYHVQCKIITPVHIGAGGDKGKLSKNEYNFDFRKRQLVIIDPHKLIQHLKSRRLFEKYIIAINGKGNLYRFLKENNLLRDIEKLAKQIYRDVDFNTKNNGQNNLTLAIKNVHNQPYIPGSSLKGAIKNSLIVAYILQNPDRFNAERDTIYQKLKALSIQDYLSRGRAESVHKEIEKILSNMVDAILYGNDYANNSHYNKRGWGLSVSDSYFQDGLTTAFYQDVDKKIETEKAKTISNVREYIQSDQTLNHSITLDYQLINQGQLKLTSFNDMIQAISRASHYLTREVLGLEPDPYLILGGNTGYHQKTIIHALYKDPKQRVEVVKKLINIKGKDAHKKIGYHLDDKLASPRVLNLMRLPEYDEVAGYVQLVEVPSA